MCSFSRMPYISKCCCFISLGVSAYLIGILQSMFGLGIMIYAFVSPLLEKRVRDDDGHDVDNTDNTERNTTLHIIGSVFILLGVILIIGVKIKNSLLIKVYIVLEIIGLIIGFIIYLIILLNLFLAFVIASADTSDFVGELIRIFAVSTAQVLVVVIVIAFVIIVLKAYFLLCVNSYLKELIKLRSGTPLAVGYTAVAETDAINLKV